MLFIRAHARRARCDYARIPAACDPASVLDHYREPAPARRYRAFNAGVGLEAPARLPPVTATGAACAAPIGFNAP